MSLILPRKSTTACDQHVDSRAGAKLEGNVKAEPRDPPTARGAGLSRPPSLLLRVCHTSQAGRNKTDALKRQEETLESGREEDTWLEKCTFHEFRRTGHLSFPWDSVTAEKEGNKREGTWVLHFPDTRKRPAAQRRKGHRRAPAAGQGSAHVRVVGASVLGHLPETSLVTTDAPRRASGEEAQGSEAPGSTGATKPSP